MVALFKKLLIFFSMSSPTAAFSILGRTIFRQKQASQKLTSQIHYSMALNDTESADESESRKWEKMYA